MSPIYTFSGGADGRYPETRLVFGPDGALYGTASGGGAAGAGVIFKLVPPAHFCGTITCSWTEHVLHSFNGGSDGSFPLGDVAFDHAGNLYGITNTNGIYDIGTAWELSSSGSFSVIYQFGTLYGRNDAIWPAGGVTLGLDGNVYGTSEYGGVNQVGTVYQLARSGSGWTEHLIYQFSNEGSGTFPDSSVYFDVAGNIYGTTLKSGANGAGTLFKLASSQGSWTFTLLHSFGGYVGPNNATLISDAGGNLYGSDWNGGSYNVGSVFEWTAQGQYLDLYDFTGGSDGADPAGNLTFDSAGNLYGMTNIGGSTSYGVVYELSSSTLHRGKPAISHPTTRNIR